MDHSWGVLQASQDGLDHPVLPSPGNHGLYMGNHPIAGLKIQVSEILEFTQIKWPLNRENMGKWSFTNGRRMIFMGKLIMDSPDLEVANFQTPKWFGGLTGPHDLVTPHELWLLVVHRKVPCFIIYESQGYPKVSGTFGCFFFGVVLEISQFPCAQSDSSDQSPIACLKASDLPYLGWCFFQCVASSKSSLGNPQPRSRHGLRKSSN